MYTNASNIIKTVMALLELNQESINKCIQIYDDSRTLTVFEGMRKSVPADAFPVLEIEPLSGTTQWATTRAQRPRYQFECTLTVINNNEELSVEYVATIANAIISILSNPQNLQMIVTDEFRWDVNGGLHPTKILDSNVDNVIYNSNKEGTIRVITWYWYALIHEPYPSFAFDCGQLNGNVPTVVKPKGIDLD